ncbi:prenyltransferase [Gordonia sp. ABSL1-1]|uniref:prenyltransferase n=1 Tax=Gordonia sp. ABSL1-1 TaxID=3053923 RepID=UPI0025738DAA|nr:prenyltransferase [Gordonia sp. ABSL1-1]MDL9936563.1 prenyltransferase [Gordonia sp. ABSL1-1]
MTAIPAIAGVVSAGQIHATGAAIAAMQEESGALPWFPGGQTDPWDHIESAMALSVTGFVAEAQAAYEWSRRTQRADGSWPIRIVNGHIEDDGVDSNFCAYIAVGVWHHYMITGDLRFLERMWPMVWSAMECVLRFQRSDGVFRWGGDHHTGAMFSEAQITGNASIFQSFDCAIRIAAEMDQDDSLWVAAHTVLGDALRADVAREEFEIFVPPSEHSMDWYYPVLGGAVRGKLGQELIASRWNDFVVPELGTRCVDHRPWVTGAETSELALALDALGDTADAIELIKSIQHLRDPDGSYWTGLVYADGKRWPVEKSCWTSAAVVLAVDAVSRTSVGNGIFRDVRHRLSARVG